MVQAESLCGKFQTGTVRVNGTNFDSVKQVSENFMSRKWNFTSIELAEDWVEMRYLISFARLSHKSIDS